MSIIIALGSPVFTGQSGAGSSAGLDAQLARYQVQLSDWVNCPSCNTAEGKAKIQELSDKVRETEQSIKAADTQTPIGRPSFQGAALTRHGNQNEATPTLNVVSFGSRPSTGPAFASGTVGTRLNVYA